MGPHTQHVEGFHQDTRHFLTTRLSSGTGDTPARPPPAAEGGGAGGHLTTEFLVSRVALGVNQGQFQYFSEIIKSESVGLRAMVAAQSGPYSHGGAWGQPSWSPVSSGEAWPELLNT